MKALLLLLATAFFALGPVPTRAVALQADDVDGKPVRLNAPDAVTAVISSSPETQVRTREAGARLDRFRGRHDFRLVIVVDLRDSLAGMVTGYVKGRIRKDLDAEAERLRPFYRANGNLRDPRADLATIPDFGGTAVDRLHWDKDASRLRVTVFGTDGRELKKWDDLKDPSELDRAVSAALGSAPKP